MKRRKGERAREIHTERNTKEREKCRGERERERERERKREESGTTKERTVTWRKETQEKKKVVCKRPQHHKLGLPCKGTRDELTNMQRQLSHSKASAPQSD